MPAFDRNKLERHTIAGYGIAAVTQDAVVDSGENAQFRSGPDPRQYAVRDQSLSERGQAYRYYVSTTLSPVPQKSKRGTENRQRSRIGLVAPAP